jgi:hypothetical protein
MGEGEYSLRLVMGSRRILPPVGEGEYGGGDGNKTGVRTIGGVKI